MRSHAFLSQERMFHMINTCTVTNIADRKSRQMLPQSQKMNPEAIVVATSCVMQTGGEKLEKASHCLFLETREINIVESAGRICGKQTRPWFIASQDQSDKE